jgi:hypothetical protein
MLISGKIALRFQLHETAIANREIFTKAFEISFGKTRADDVSDNYSVSRIGAGRIVTERPDEWKRLNANT